MKTVLCKKRATRILCILVLFCTIAFSLVGCKQNLADASLGDSIHLTEAEISQIECLYYEKRISELSELGVEKFIAELNDIPMEPEEVPEDYPVPDGMRYVFSVTMTDGSDFYLDHYGEYIIAGGKSYRVNESEAHAFFWEFYDRKASHEELTAGQSKLSANVPEFVPDEDYHPEYFK